MDLTANGTLTDTAILGGRIPQLAFDAALAQDTLHVKAVGTFAGFDPAVVSGEAGAERHGRRHPGRRCDGRRTSRPASRPTACRRREDRRWSRRRIGGLDITRAQSWTATITTRPPTSACSTSSGRDVNVQASGTLALNETGQSNLKVHADTPSLEQIGKLVNQPLAGIARIDATVTGNKRELQAPGNLTATASNTGENGALAMSRDFTAKVPELDGGRRRASRRTPTPRS